MQSFVYMHKTYWGWPSLPHKMWHSILTTYVCSNCCCRYYDVTTQGHTIDVSHCALQDLINTLMLCHVVMHRLTHLLMNIYVHASSVFPGVTMATKKDHYEMEKKSRLLMWLVLCITCPFGKACHKVAKTF